MQTSLRGIAKRAKEDPKHQFGNLYSLLNEANLHWCFPQLNRKAAPGVDAVDYETFEAKLDENISHLVSDLKDREVQGETCSSALHPESRRATATRNTRSGGQGSTNGGCTDTVGHIRAGLFALQSWLRTGKRPTASSP